jgi:hypothetical protein
MEIRIRQTGEVVTESQFRAANKNTSLPRQLSEALLNELGADVVFEGPQASGGDQYQFSQRSGVEQINGKWYTKYVLGPIFTDRPAEGDQPAMTVAEQEAAYKAQKDAEQSTAIRNDRNKRLADCDWTQLADSTADKAAWATYRQALRDITTQDGFPWNVTWPVQPGKE